MQLLEAMPDCPALRAAHFGNNLTTAAATHATGCCRGVRRLTLGDSRSGCLYGFGLLMHSWKSLQEVAMDGAVAFARDDALAVVGALCPALQVLTIRGESGHLGDIGVVAVAKGCLQLRRLSLARAQLSGASFAALACAPELRQLSFHLCGGVRGDSLDALAAGCPKLEWLDVTEPEPEGATPGVPAHPLLTPGCLASLHANRPGLQINYSNWQGGYFECGPSGNVRCRWPTGDGGFAGAATDSSGDEEEPSSSESGSADEEDDSDECQSSGAASDSDS
jgi:hypothetical protein